MEDCIPASKWCVFKRLNMAAQVPSTPVTDMTNGLDQDHWRFNRWEEGTQVVLIRTDVNHADLMNESFHVMEVESEGQETGRVYKLRKWDDHGKIVLAHSTALMKASDFVLSQFTKLDASEKEYVTHNIFQMWPGLLAERQANAPTPVLVTTPRSYPNTRSPSPRRCSNKQTWGDAVRQAEPAPGLEQPPGIGPSGPPPSKAPPNALNRAALPGMQVQTWGAGAGGGGGHPQTVQVHDRYAIWAHEPTLDQVMETTDIYRFPEHPGCGIYKTIFVCCHCLTKWRSPAGTGSTPYVSRLGFQFFCVNVFWLFFCPLFNTRVQVTSAAHFRTKRVPWAGSNHPVPVPIPIGRDPDAQVATNGNGPVGC